jgi:AcrR family transcriptional regulator
MNSDAIEAESTTSVRRGRPPRHPLPAPEDRADAILDAALVVFADRGYAATGMEDIARRCRMTKPTIYEYFPGKAQLFDALTERERRTLLATLRDTYRSSAGAGFWEKLRIDTAAFVRWVCDRPDSFALLHLIPCPQSGLKRRAEMRADIAAAVVESMETWLEKQGRRGDASITALAYMVNSSVLGAVMAAKHLLPEHADTVTDLAAGFVAAGLRHVPPEALVHFDEATAAVHNVQ